MTLAIGGAGIGGTEGWRRFEGGGNNEGRPEKIALKETRGELHIFNRLTGCDEVGVKIEVADGRRVWRNEGESGIVTQGGGQNLLRHLFRYQ